MYKTEAHNDWCHGCGDFGILRSIQDALADMELLPHQVAIFSGIGCSGKTPHFVHTYGIHTLHGRSLPFAMGAKLANPELTVLAVGGDGDGYGIGVGHMVNSGRRNVDMTYIVFNNGVYGLTKGQASPTLARNQQPKSLPLPNINDAINPLALALCVGFTFIARGHAYNVKALRMLITRAIQHKGLALIDVLQSCPTYNEEMYTKDWGDEEVELEDGTKAPRVYSLENMGYDPVVHDPSNIDEIVAKQSAAFALTQQTDRFPIGVYYQIELPTYEERLAERIPMLKETSAAKQIFADPSGKPVTDLSKMFESFSF
jgi:2-oxoglutarate ferredoxin oxidoreductase subunit beta